MTSFTKKLTAALLAVLAAVCLAFGLFFAVPQTASADAAQETLDNESGYLDIEGTVFKGLKNKDDTNTLQKYLNGKTFRIDLPNDITEIAGVPSAQSLKTSILGATYAPGLVSISLPTSLQKIGEYAFNNCTALEDITLLQNVESIGEGAFKNCSSLKSLAVTATGELKTIGQRAFEECTSLTSVTIPSNVSTIGQNAFNGCTKLEAINYYATGAVVTTSPFSRIGNAVVKIQGQTGKTISSLSPFLFRETNVKEVIFSSVDIASEKWGQETFYGCKKLEKVTFESTCKVGKIGHSAFKNCSALVSVSMPAGLTAIDQEAFYGCSSLMEITIPSGVASLGADAFYGCSGLLQVVDNAKIIGTANDKSNIGNKVAVITDGSTKISTDSDGFSFFNGDTKYLIGYTGGKTVLTLPSGSYRIYKNAFNGNTSITEINIPSNVLGIGDGAFENCASLTKVFVSGGVGNEIGTGAFSGCTKLEDVTLSEGVSKVGAEMFKGCIKLEKISIPSTVTKIDNSAFMDCAKLNEVKFNLYVLKGTVTSGNENEVIDSFYRLTSIEAYAFKNCTGLKEITFYDAKALNGAAASPTAVGFGANVFEGCSTLTAVKLPANASFNTNIFEKCPDSLLIAAPNYAAYNKYIEDANLSAYRSKITYTVELELYNITGTTESLTGSEDRYYGIQGQPLPLQTGYKSSVWYTKNDGTLSANPADLNLLLAQGSEAGDKIKLYAHFIEKPTIDKTKTKFLTYNRGSSQLTTANLKEWFNDNADLKDKIGVIGSTGGEYTYTAEILKYRDMSGETSLGSSAGGMVNAGHYTLQIIIGNPTVYGAWEDDENLQFTVYVSPAKISNVFELLEWGVVGDNSITDLLPKTESTEATYLYNYGTSKWYEKTQPGATGEETKVQVLRSYLLWDGAEKTVRLKSDGIRDNITYFTVNGYTGEGYKGTDGGKYRATVTIAMSNNYALPNTSDSNELEMLANLGISIEDKGNNWYEISKIWYIVSTETNRLVSETGDYTIADWTYADDKANIPAAPKLVKGNAEDLKFTLIMKESVGGEDLRSLEFYYKDFSKYICKAMPSGFYSLNTNVPSFTGNDVTYEGGPVSINFTVGEASPYKFTALPNAENPYVSSVNPINNKEISADYEKGKRVFGIDEENLPILGLDTVYIHPSRAGTVWNNDEYDKFYSGFNIRYRHDADASGIYRPDDVSYTYQEPSTIGTHTIYYQIYAPGYEVVEGRYVLSIAGAIKKPSVSVTYTGKSWVGLIFNDEFFDAVYLNGKKNYIDGGNRAIDSERLIQNLIAKNALPSDFVADDYIEAGKHYVALYIRDNYSKTAKWEKTLDVIEGVVGGECIVFEFMINKASNATKVNASVKPWDFGSFNQESNKPVWRTEFDTSQQFKIISKADAAKTSERDKTYYWYEPEEGQLGFGAAPAGDYWLIPVAIGTDNVRTFDASDAELYQEGEWFSFVIEKATISWVSAPHMNSWRYGEDKYVSAPLGKLPESIAELVSSFNTYICLESGYGDPSSEKYASFDEIKNKFKQANETEGHVPAGDWVFVYSYEGDENYNEWNSPVYFTVLTADNHWEVTPVIHDFVYGTFPYGGTTSMLLSKLSFAPEFGTKDGAAFEFSYYNINGELTVSKQSSIKALGLVNDDEYDRIPVGKYQYKVTIKASDNYNALEFVSEFYITESENGWKKTPNIIGWSEGNFSIGENKPVAEDSFGSAVFFTVKDANGDVVTGLERITADYFTPEKLNALGVGNYTLVAEVEASGSGDYKGISAEVNFAVFEDNVGMTGLIAATMVFAVLAVGLAVGGIIFLIRRNKKIEEEFRNMVKAELDRR